MDNHQTSTYHSTFLIAASSLPLLPILISLFYMSYKPILNSVSTLKPSLFMPIIHMRSACSFLIHVIRNPMCHNIRSNTDLISNAQRSSEQQYYYKCEPGSSAECAICLSQVEEGEEIGEVRCTHVFHKVCLDSWVVLRVTCPVCRSQIIRGEERIVIHLRLMQPRACSRSRGRGDNFWLR